MKILATVALLFPFCVSAATIGYNCAFKMEATPSGLKKLSEPFMLNYISDSSTGKAYLMGNNGSADVSVVSNTGGVFGAPTFFVGDQMFWGQDRIEQVKAVLMA